MPKNILVDLNIILDVVHKRRGFDASKTILKLQESAAYKVYVSAHIVTTFAYLLEQAKVPAGEILRQIDWLLRTFNVVPTTGKLLTEAIASKIRDYEDAVIERAAVACGASVIVTRNISDFKKSSIRAMTPEQYAAML